MKMTLNAWCHPFSPLKFAPVVVRLLAAHVFLSWFLVSAATVCGSEPKVVDPRLKLTEFASSPTVVTPSGIAVDSAGRVFVIESHTHFRPDDYTGPKADRILILEDTDDDGQADKKVVYHEGFTHGMDLAFSLEGVLYVATRAAIYRLPDLNRDDRPDTVERIIELDTPGDYPHNGLSGLSFDAQGRLYFGLGENLGQSYRLVGSDGVTFSGGGEGGSTYRVLPGGSKLERMSTGWWNPFGMAVDSLGRVFGTDNDPGESPPCRLIQVVADGNYGYEYRYGRTGLNPLMAWTGDLPGTLPMTAATGEAPCGIIAYEGLSFPNKYYGALFVPTWADHYIEVFQLQQKPDRGFVSTDRQKLVQGGNDFRPVDIAQAPDGSLFISDWVLARYQLHGQGRIWHLSASGSTPSTHKSTAAIVSLDRPTRERAAGKLLDSDKGRARLQSVLQSSAPPHVRGTALQLLGGLTPTNRPRDFEQVLHSIILNDPSIAIKQLAIEQLGPSWNPPVSKALPPVLKQARLRLRPDLVLLSEFRAALKSPDPLMRFSAISGLADPSVGKLHADKLSLQHLDAVILAARRGWSLSKKDRKSWLERGLSSTQPDAQLVAIKWIADDQLIEFQDSISKLWYRSDLGFREFRALFVCEQRLADKPVTDWPSAERLGKLLSDTRIPPSVSRWVIRVAVRRDVPLELDWLTKRIKLENLQEDVLWAIAAHRDVAKLPILERIASDRNFAPNMRAVALNGMAAHADSVVDSLLTFSKDPSPLVSSEALRALVGVELNLSQRRRLESLKQDRPDLREEVVRVLTGKLPQQPGARDIGSWSELLKIGAGDRSSGERLFFHPKLATCGKCHTVMGKGIAVGPSMTAMHRRLESLEADSRQWLLETILQPSRDMAPQYTPWQIVTTDGRIVTGLPRRKGGSAEAYLGIDGKEFRLKKEDIDEHRESAVSLMPEGLLQGLTIQEIRDLIAFLEAPLR